MNTNEKLRDGLETIIKRINEAIKTDNAQFLTGALLHIRETAKGMLAIPCRNCDIGTAEEQMGRYLRFCSSHVCRSCPVKKITNLGCELGWAQLPYEKEGRE